MIRPKKIDDALRNIKVCDPAIGSGAFPVGMMSEIIKTRNVLSAFIKDRHRTVYDFKRECIEKSLYGVDIDPGAVEIAKLRLWLSLVVDEDDIKQIKPCRIWIIISSAEIRFRGKHDVSSSGIDKA